MWHPIHFLTIGLLISCGEKSYEDNDKDDDNETERSNEGSSMGDCIDGVDNDGDGLIDCQGG